MNRFWEDVIGPVVKKIDAKYIVEVGCKDGKNTLNILNYCRENEAKATLIDPFPQFNKNNLLDRYKGYFELYEDLSLNVLYKLSDYDVILLDGDHNYYTVYNELKSIEKKYRNKNLPIIFMHDITWPYARRDLYYNPSNIPDRYRYPYEKKGMLLGQGTLSEEGGLNTHLFNAIYENDMENGILTAVEDFLAQTNLKLEFIKFECFNGLGILIPEFNKEIIEFVHNIKTSDKLLKKLENNRNELEIKLSDIRKSKEKKKKDIDRLNGEIKEVELKINNMEQKLLEKEKEIIELEKVKGKEVEGLKKVQEELEREKKELENRLEELEKAKGKEVEELKRTYEEVENKLQQSEENIEELKQKIQNLRNEKERVQKNKFEYEKLIQDYKDQIKEINRNNNNIRNELTKTKSLHRDAMIAAETHLNSIRYRIGDVLVNGMKSPKDMILIPENLYKLYKEGKENNKRRKIKEINREEKNTNKRKKYKHESEKNSKYYKKINSLLEKKYNDTKYNNDIQKIIYQNVSDNFYKTFIQSEENIDSLCNFNVENEPLVSIIMPTYNRVNILLDAINSIFSQSYKNWELIICDDASTDNTEDIVYNLENDKIKYLKLRKMGAAAARNEGLKISKGKYIAYLDSDNIWHPKYLEIMIKSLLKEKGKLCAYSNYIDVKYEANSKIIKRYKDIEFNYDELSEKNFIDLNSFVHNRVLFETFGGFNTDLKRRQDWDLVLKYTHLRDPIYANYLLNIYRRNDDWNQITKIQKEEIHSINIIEQTLKEYYSDAIPSNILKKPTITILSWDICRNHFSKAYNIAESLSKKYNVQLLGFRFFENKIFEPYVNENPNFEVTYIDAVGFPEFSDKIIEAVNKIKGEVIYAVKPRLASFGVALLANYHYGKKVILEFNDLETVVTNPQKENQNDVKNILKNIDYCNEELLNPYGKAWTIIMEQLAHKMPLTTTHNKNLNSYFGNKSIYVRNLKDEKYFNPDIYNRDKIKKELGFKENDRVILFGGMLRKHKGIYQLIKLLDNLNDNRYKLLFVGSRVTPDQKKLIEEYGHIIKVLPPQGRNEMAKINYAADLVILWLDPNISASHYQMPYKFTDAIAMKVPVIANDISDLGVLGKQGYLKLVDFEDYDNLVHIIHEIFSKKEDTEEMVSKARKLYLRQFSYNAIRNNFDLLINLAYKDYDISEISQEFANIFSKFYTKTIHGGE